MNSTRHRQHPVPLATLLATLALLRILSIAQLRTAHAEETIVEVVRYGDLNIHSEAGRKTLLKRINAAVDRACGESSYPRSLRQREFRNCRSKTLDNALAQIDWSVSSGAEVRIQPPHLEVQTELDSKQHSANTINHKGVFVGAQ